MTYKRLQIISFLVFLLAVFILVVWVVKPFLGVLAFGVIISILFWPLYQRFKAWTKSPSLGSLLTVLLILLIVLIPVWLFGQLIFNQAFDFYHLYRSGDLAITSSPVFQHLSPATQNTLQNLISQVGEAVGRFTSHAFETVSGLLSNVLGFFLSSFLFFFTIFFVLRDGEKIKIIIMDISPLAKEQENTLFHKIADAVNGVVKGAFLVALVQGFVATIGFVVFGIPQPVLWGLFTVLVALVPTVGTSLSLIPAVIYLFITGHTGASIGLMIWGALAVGLIDNIVGPKFIGSRTKLHPLLVFISIIGGIQLFGFAGFLIGPIIMAVFMALVDMYRTDFKVYLENQ